MVFFDDSAAPGLSALCNTHRTAVVLDGVHFVTAEHAMQHCKIRCAMDAARSDERRGELRRCLSLFSGKDTTLRKAEQVRQIGQAIHLRRNEMEEWRRRSVGYQERVCMYKFTQSKAIRDALRDSGDATLVRRQHSPGCFWGGREDARGRIVGRNMLGVAWMKIRDAF